MKLLKFNFHDAICSGFIFLVSLFTVSDLFINTGKSANGDGLVHTVMPVLFAEALKMGQFPVSWTDGFANYGLPLGLIAQQLTTYLTAIFTLATHNPSIAFNITVFLGLLLSNIFFYIFLRIYFDSIPSFIGIFLFNFSPYRILNLYIRGALPEFFASVFMPLLLISAYLIIKKRNIYGVFLLTITFCLLVLTHPFMLIVALFLLTPYVIFLLCTQGNSIKFMKIKSFIKYGFIFFLAGGIGLGLAAYYMLPLSLEIKYFYYGQTKNHLTPNNFLMLSNFINYNWHYFFSSDVADRGFIIYVGILESILVIIGSIYFLYNKIRTKFKEISIIDFAVAVSILTIFMTTTYASFLYSHISFLSNIQFPWRMLSAFIFMPPIILAFFLEKIRQTKILMLVVIFLICLLSFPQLYGKNYRLYSYSDYIFTPYNLHAVVMNPIWTGRSEDYPIENKKWGIIDGIGTVSDIHDNYSLHSYIINAQTSLRMVDYTFYFPGWNVYVDSRLTRIEFQDPKYRGVITYNVPPGLHTVSLKFEDTKIRELAKLITLFFIFIFTISLFFRQKLQRSIWNNKNI